MLLTHRPPPQAAAPLAGRGRRPAGPSAHASSPFIGQSTSGDNGAAFSAAGKPVLDAGSGWDPRAPLSSPQQLFRQQPGASGGTHLDRLRIFSGSANQVLLEDRRSVSDCPKLWRHHCLL